jgi:hypothetical protein
LGRRPTFVPRTNVALTFGSYPPTGSFYQGVLDEISLYTRPLTQAEVVAVYASGIVGKEPPDGNLAPVVSAGPDVAVAAANGTAALNGSVTDDGKPVGVLHIHDCPAR